MSSSSIDLLRVAINLGGNKATIREMLTLFITSTTALLQELKPAIEAENAESCRSLLHKMKGAAQNVSAMRLADLCREAESNIAAGQSVTSCFASIQQEFEAVQAAIDAHLKTFN